MASQPANYSPAQPVQPSTWDALPTALDAAHYDRLLRLGSSRSAQRQQEAEEVARRIFGECLLTLTRLGLAERNARSLLGKWRKEAGDDARLIGIIQAAGRAGVPDPAAYVTAAIRGDAERQDKAENLRASHWQLVGWERPKGPARPSGPSWKGDMRGQVWRDPFGKLTILPAPSGAQIPTLDQDPGVEI